MPEPTFREKLLSLQVMSRTGKGHAVREYRDERDGHRIKATRDELNNVVTEHAVKGDRVDVNIRPLAPGYDPNVKVRLSPKENP